mmetsp:Transcript_12908/g.36184  ORF Transcript_12908/g.36184 Transcript_12908/m.36184 type:complete len:278 (-) Transcript_12908:47-880(-)
MQRLLDLRGVQVAQLVRVPVKGARLDRPRARGICRAARASFPAPCHPVGHPLRGFVQDGGELFGQKTFHGPLGRAVSGRLAANDPSTTRLAPSLLLLAHPGPQVQHSLLRLLLLFLDLEPLLVVVRLHLALHLRALVSPLRGKRWKKPRDVFRGLDDRRIVIPLVSKCRLCLLLKHLVEALVGQSYGGLDLPLLRLHSALVTLVQREVLHLPSEPFPSPAAHVLHVPAHALRTRSNLIQGKQDVHHVCFRPVRMLHELRQNASEQASERDRPISIAP